MIAGIAVTFTEEAAILVECTMGAGDDEELVHVGVIEVDDAG